MVATDLSDYLDWQQKRPRAGAGKVVRLTTHRGAAPATMNRRIAAVRGLFEFAVTSTGSSGTIKRTPQRYLESKGR